MATRFNGYTNISDDFEHKILVHCNQCNLCAIYKNNKLICTHCGYSKDKVFRYNLPPLWLRTTVYGESLYAYNYEHLTYIENHIFATLRERGIQTMRNRSIGSRLPKWALSKKNRHDVLRAIDILKTK